MLRSIKDLEHYAIGATDGDIGRVKDFYFDDDSWVVRYLVVDTGSWLAGRSVLISPISLQAAPLLLAAPRCDRPANGWRRRTYLLATVTAPTASY